MGALNETYREYSSFPKGEELRTPKSKRAQRVSLLGVSLFKGSQVEPITRICSKCLTSKLLTDFPRDASKRQGRKGQCNLCFRTPELKAYQKKWRQEHPDYKTDWFKKYPDYWKCWEQQHPENNAKRVKKYSHSVKGITKRKSYLGAQQLLRDAILKGIVIRPLNCSQCDSNKTKIEGHHENYSKPLDVVWLCSSCHHNLHNERT